jgi:hypothetical protein
MQEFLVPLKAYVFQSFLDRIGTQRAGSDKNELTAITRYGILCGNKEALKKVAPQNCRGIFSAGKRGILF